MMRIIRPTLVLLTLFLGSRAESEDCPSRFAQWARTRNDTKLEQVLQLFEKKSTTGSLDILWNSPEFKAYLQKRGSTWAVNADEKEKFRLVGEYVDAYLSRYRDEGMLQALRDQALRKAMRIHGRPATPGLPARQSWQRLSKENLARILRGKKYVSSPEMLEAETLVDSLQVFLAHNSHIMYNPPQYPVVAPREIEKMGLPNFSMSSNGFNQYIGSTDHVYFFVNFRNKNSSANLRSEYGKFGVIVDNRYAAENATISPYIMYVHHIFDAVKDVDPPAARALFQKRVRISEDGTVTWHSAFGKVTDKAEISRAIASVHKFDFTLDDFEFLLKTQLLISLRELRSKDPAAYRGALEELREAGDFHKKGPGTIHAIFNRLVFEPLGMPWHFEGRIPVAVPNQHLIHFEN